MHRTMLWICGIGLLVSAGAACGDDDEETPTSEGTATTAAADGSPVADELQAFASENFSLPVMGEASTAWSISEDLPGLFNLVHAQGQGYIHMSFPVAVHSYDGLAQEDVPADPVAWVKAHPRLNILSEEAVTIGGLDGVQLEVTSDEEIDWEFFETEGDTFFVFGPDHLNLVVLDTSVGPLFLAFGSDQPTRYSQIIPEAQHVLDSLEFAE